MNSKPSIKNLISNMLSCKEYTKLCCKSEVENLSFFERLCVKFHHIICFTCRRFSKQIDFLNSACKKVMNENSLQEEVTLSDSAKERIKNKLEASTK